MNVVYPRGPSAQDEDARQQQVLQAVTSQATRDLNTNRADVPSRYSHTMALPTPESFRKNATWQ